MKRLAPLCCLLLTSALAAVEPTLAVGGRHSLYLADDGTVWAWGDNDRGQLGHGGFTDSPVPKQVTGLPLITALAAGLQHSMALDSEGRVWLWGDDTYGQIADGTVGGGSQLTPRLSSASQIRAIACGANHCLALRTDSTAVAWGYNLTGCLGDASSTNRATPVTVSGGATFREIAGGGTHSLGLTTDGTMLAWGSNNHGQLGIGVTGGTYTTPQPIAFGQVVDIACGSDHSLLVNASGNVYSWGDNAFGQCGDSGAPTDRNTPTSAGVGAAVACGGGSSHSWAIRANGIMAVWGGNDQAQVQQSAGSPSQVNAPFNLNFGGQSYRSAACGPAASHLLVIANDSSSYDSAVVLGWGDNSYDQLGTGSTSDHSATAVTTQATWPVSGIVAIAQGQNHSHGLASDGRVWSWGYNGLGQGGEGSGAAYNTMPVLAANVSNATGISAGHDFGDHSAAVTGTGTLWAWGANSFGQLGNGTTATATTPIAVPTGGFYFKQVSVGDYHTIALTTNGTIRSWGRDHEGQLGDNGTLADKGSPVSVSGASSVIRITAGANHNLALRTDGTVYAWGDNVYGQIGDGTTTDRPTPVLVPGLSGVIDVCAGAYHSLALMADGTIKAWGYNGFGQLADGTTTNRSTPITVQFSSGVDKIYMRHIAAARFHSMGIDLFGNLWTWGYNGNGQLGIASTVAQSYTANVSFSDDYWMADGGWRITILLRPDGTVWGCGNNGSYQIGIGSTSPFDSLVPIQTSSDWLPQVSYDLASSSTAGSETGPTNAKLRVQRTGSLAGALTVDFTRSGTATYLADFTLPSGASSLTIAGGAAGADVVVQPQDDSIDEDSESATITLATASGRYRLGTTVAATATIADNDTAGIIVTPTSGLTTTEAGGTAVFKVRLATRPQSGTVTINLSSSNPGEGTVPAVPGNSLVFDTGNWNTEVDVTITGRNDDVDDGNIAYTITTAAAIATDPKYNGLNAADVSVTNLDNDTAGITVTPTSGLSVSEAGGSDTFTVTLDTKPTQPVGISFTSLDTSEASVSPPSISLDGSNWSSGLVVTVNGVDDDGDDGDLGFTIRTNAATSSDANYNGINPADVTGTCVDDDTAGLVFSESGGSTAVVENGATDTYTVTLASQPTGAVTIALTTNSEVSVSPTSIGFTALNWNNPVTVTVTAVDDPDLELPEPPGEDGTVTHDPSGADYGAVTSTVLAVDVSSEDVAGARITPAALTITEGSSGSYKVELKARPTAGSHVVIRSTSANTAVATITSTPDASDPVDLYFGYAASGDGSGSDSGNLRTWNDPITITVNGEIDFPDSLQDVTTITITAPVSAGTDGDFSGIDPTDVTVTVDDIDVAAIKITESGGTTLVDESGSTDLVAVGLTTDPAAGNGTLVAVGVTASSDVTVSPSTLFFTFSGGSWSADQNLTVSATDDAVDEATPHAGSFSLAVTATTSAGDYVADGSVAATVNVGILDDDSAGVTVSPVAGLITTEAGGQATFSAVLTSRPTADVTLTFTSSRTAEAGHPSAVTFTTAQWSTAKTVTVTGAADAVDDGDQNFDIATTVTSSDGSYAGIPVANITGTNLDDDSVAVLIDIGAGVAVTEAGGSDTYSIALATEPTGVVRVSIAPDGQLGTSATAVHFAGPSLVGGGDGSGSSTGNPRLWSNAYSVTVTAVDDDVDENTSHSGTISHAVSGSDYGGLAVDGVSATITDNDSAGIVIGGTASGPVLESLDGASSFLTSTATTGATGVIQFTAGTDLSSLFVGQFLIFEGGGANDSVQTEILAVDDGLDTVTVPAAPVADAGPETIVLVAGFPVRLATRPLSTVVVFFASDDESEGFAFPDKLTFTPDNWSTLQIVHVVGEDDDVDDGDTAFAIDALPAASLDPAYNGLVGTATTVSNVDDDTHGITIDIGDGVVTSEAGGSDTFTIVLDSEPTADVSVALSSSLVSQGTSDPTTVTFTASDWYLPQTVTVTGLDGDGTDNGAGVAYSIVTAAATVSNGTDSDYDGEDAADVAVTNLAVNAAPTIDAPLPMTIDEDAGATVVDLTGIGTGQSGEVQTITITAASSNAVLIPTPTITYTSPDSTGTLSFTAAADAFGSAVITVTVQDTGGTANGGNDTTEVSFLVTVSAVNDPPAVDIDGDATPGNGISPAPAYTELDPPVSVVDPASLTVTDLDDTTASSATVTLSPRPDGSDETLAVDVGTTGITAGYNATTGVLTLTAGGPLPLLDWITVLRTLTYHNASLDPDESPRTVAVVVNDGASDSAADSATVTVTSVPFPPVVDLNGAAAGEDLVSGFVEGDGSVAIVAAGATVVDPDSLTLSGATITITNLLDTSLETLSVNTAGTGITATWVAPVLTLSGAADISAYQAVLRSLAYGNSSEDPSTTDRVVTVVVSDGANSSVSRNATVTVSPQNDAPVVTVNTGINLGISGTFAIGRPQLDADDVDDAQNTLTFGLLLVPNLGQLQLDGTPLGVGSSFTWSHLDDGTRLRYVHGGVTAGTDGFAFRVNDGTTQGNLELFDITVTGLVPPVLTLSATSTLTYTENAVPLQVDDGISCLDSDSTSFNGGNVTVSISGGGDGSEELRIGSAIPAITLSGNQVFHGAAALGTWAGGSGGTDLVIGLTSTSATPTTVQDLLRAIEFRVLGDDPTATTRNVELTVNDGGVVSTPVTRNVAVVPVNDAPQVAYGTVLTVPVLDRVQQLLISDAEGDTTTALVSAAPTKGALSLDPGTGIFTYTAFPAVSGSDSFAVTVSDDGSPIGTTIVTVPVRISDLGDATPVIINNPPLQVVVGDPLLFIPQVAEAGSGATPQFELLGLSTGGGLTFSAATGTLSWTAVPMPGDGYHEFGILLSDPVNQQASYLPILLRVVPVPAGGG